MNHQLKKIAVVVGLFACSLLCSSSLFAAESSEQNKEPNQIERIEPSCWWVGMKSDKLELMVHGTNIADTTPELNYPGVHIDTVTRVENRNYLFIDLTISPTATAGKFNLLFKHNEHGGAAISYPYELLAREKNSANRASFTSADVILNLMPDRFANGDPGNDNVPGFADKLNRSDDGAGRHGGDIKGIEDHLDYIAAMGYTMIWPTPLTENNQKSYSYHGYAATDTYKIDARFGTITIRSQNNLCTGGPRTLGCKLSDVMRARLKQNLIPGLEFMGIDRTERFPGVLRRKAGVSIVAGLS